MRRLIAGWLRIRRRRRSEEVIGSLLALIMVVAFAACGDSSEGKDSQRVAKIHVSYYPEDGTYSAQVLGFEYNGCTYVANEKTEARAVAQVKKILDEGKPLYCSGKTKLEWKGEYEYRPKVNQ